MSILKSHARLFAALLVGAIVASSGPWLGISSRLTQSLVGYDVGALIYIVWAFFVMRTSTKTDIRKRALTQDDGKFVVLILVVTAVVFSICAIFIDLAMVKTLTGDQKSERLALAVTTIILSWVFMNFVFALHYAHDYFYDFQNGRQGGLIFLPEDEEPNYFDFLYFSSVIGATAQTADVTLSSKKMRRTCLLHSTLAFFFNTTILALTINMASGLL